MLPPTMADKPYAPNSFFDKVNESWAGEHDFAGGHLQGAYDSVGNWGLSGKASSFAGFMAGVNVPLTLPMAWPILLNEYRLDAAWLLYQKEQYKQDQKEAGSPIIIKK